MVMIIDTPLLKLLQKFIVNYKDTDEERKVKMVMVDKNSLALISAYDPELMLSKPKGLTKRRQVRMLFTHAVEALVTPGAYNASQETSIERLNSSRSIFLVLWQMAKISKA